ncbi:AAA family ATPase [Marinifilum flexuosum]|uniref:AAA family ATPase n=1 Tax=Marinifilum flexuosum TaxID=1117708 RepID=UPI0024919129|nr:ATP-dependent endonuclease [Marinifilum flexuosum]
MHIENVEIKNFRLLRDISLSLDKKSTIIVGRNNSGKTSLTEIYRRFFSNKTPMFKLEDFSLSAIEKFKEAYVANRENKTEQEVRDILPSIELVLVVDYTDDQNDYGILSDFIIDLDPEIYKAKIKISYRLQDGMIDSLFSELELENRLKFNEKLRERIPQYYNTEVTTIDITDEENVAKVELTKLNRLIGIGFINAQRGLDDVTQSEKDVLGKVLANIFQTASKYTASDDMKEKSQKVEEEVEKLKASLSEDLQPQVDALLPSLGLFGYPGLSDPNITTITSFDAKTIIENNTKILYEKPNGINLPETYNGLGSRNLIYILFQLFEFFREYQANAHELKSHIVFIEEPEAHLHPQMQEVFIRKLYEVANTFSRDLNNNQQWPVQFVVSTHSSHIANQAGFGTLRYFLTKGESELETEVKDFHKKFIAPENASDREFIHKYMTLTKCDLFFADKAILIEGPTERILMPKLIQKVDQNENKSLAQQYITLIEVGGAYAHHFYGLLDFLELKTLVVTDLDSVRLEKASDESMKRKACVVNKGEFTSNGAIKKWFENNGVEVSLEELNQKTPSDKVNGYRRIAYQIPEPQEVACGRSFEDAFMLCNKDIFSLDAEDPNIEDNAYKEAEKHSKKKTEFALKYAINIADWNVPYYLKEGLIWLSNENENQENAIVENQTVEA